MARLKDINGRPKPIFSVLSSITDMRSIAALDRICRMVHAINFLSIGDELNWLFLNIDPKVILYGKRYGSFFSELLDAVGLPPSRVVIEIVEHPIKDQTLLMETVNYYKQLGCLLAIDDFGAGQSNFERIWTLEPDIIKLDRSMIEAAACRKKIRNLMPGIVSLLHQAGSLVLIEGIETEKQALIALDADADLVQGFYFARPSSSIPEKGRAKAVLEPLLKTHKLERTAFDEHLQDQYRFYCREFHQAVEKLKIHDELSMACRQLAKVTQVARCYLLQPNGIQIGPTLISPQYTKNNDPRFAPLENAESADWFRRHYFRRALLHPGQLQITRPYLSIAGAHMCVTLSMMYECDGENRIFCCDIRV